jgi:hypothetical protein
MPTEERFWLDDEKGLLPRSSSSCQKHQEKAVCLLEGRSFDLSAEDHQLLAQQCIHCNEFGLAFGKVYRHA